MKKTFAILALLALAGCSASNVPDIKTHAAATWKQAGFEVVGYEGYNWTGFGQWGGCVWYSLRRIPDNGVTYEGCISKWSGEYHIYSLNSLDAIKPRHNGGAE
jgi:hypothetical protein